MTLLSLAGGLFLGHELGRNNLGNSFGMAVGTRMLPFAFSAVLAGFFVFMGALFGGAGTTAGILALAPGFTPFVAFTVCVSGGLVLGMLTRYGIPVSIAQSIIGALLGADIYFCFPIDLNHVSEIVFAWFYSPILSCAVAFVLFHIIRFWLHHRPVGVFYRDIWVRWGLIGVGAFSAYGIGANNVCVIIGPYLAAGILNETVLTVLISSAIFLGFLRANKQVIRTLSSGLFPLGPLESFIAVFGAALTLFAFSSTTFKAGLTFLGLPSLPLIPISVTHAVIGAIVGLALAKGRFGLKTANLGCVLAAWALVPIISGLISYGILTIVGLFGV